MIPATPKCQWIIIHKVTRNGVLINGLPINTNKIEMSLVLYTEFFSIALLFLKSDMHKSMK